MIEVETRKCGHTSLLETVASTEDPTVDCFSMEVRLAKTRSLDIATITINARNIMPRACVKTSVLAKQTKTCHKRHRVL